MTYKSNIITRVRVVPVYREGINNCINNLYQIPLTSVFLEPEYVEKFLIITLGIKPVKSIKVNYLKDPFDSENGLSRYAFVDFVWLPETNKTIGLRQMLMDFKEIFVEYKNQTMHVCIQDKTQNLLQGSLSSHVLTRVNKNNMDTVPFTGVEPSPVEPFPSSIGYRDAYVTYCLC
jgi:hypothetical protein